MTGEAARIMHDELGVITTIKKGHDGPLYIKTDDSLLQGLQPSRVAPGTETRTYRQARQARYETLLSNGALPFEARAFSGAFSIADFRTGYLARFLRARRLYIANQRAKGVSQQRINRYIETMYQRNNWYKDIHGEYDPWKMLDQYRMKQTR